MESNPPAGTKIPIKYVEANGHSGWHTIGAQQEPETRVDLQAFSAVLDPKLGWVAMPRTLELAQESDDWFG